MSCRVTIVDAYDSFVHILVGYFEKLGCQVEVFRKDDPGLHSRINPLHTDMIVLGPGPGHPEESGYLQLLELNRGRIPVLGVCLGHQAIGLFYGSKLSYAKHLMHGKTSLISHDGLGCFSSYGDISFHAMRYHSIIIDDEHVAGELKVTARAQGDNYIMGVRHKRYPVEGVQFHPESIGTESGVDILKNFINAYVATHVDTEEGGQKSWKIRQQAN